MRAILTLIIIVIAGLPSLYAGWPWAEPAWFSQRWSGVPMGAIAMSALMAVFVVLAGVCSAVARGRRAGEGEG